MSLEKTLKLKGFDKSRFPIMQKGMGAGISLSPLASAVGKEGGVGTISSVGLDQITAHRLGVEKMSLVEATVREIEETKENCGISAINIMVALERDYEKSVEGSVLGGANMIISGAGLPLDLPALVKKFAKTNDHEINLVPKVSSANALSGLIRRYWDKQGYRPDAVVLEGPRAGGHLGWNYAKIARSGDKFLEDYDLFDKLLNPVLEVAHKYPNDNGPIPVMVAGGIYTHEDVIYALSRGVAAVGLGTRFAATIESSAIDNFKKSYLKASLEDVMIAKKAWGSPCHYPFRYIKNSPLALEHEKTKSDLEEGYFCICSTLLSAAGIDKEVKGNCPEGYVLIGNDPCPARGNVIYKGLFTSGTEVHRVKEIVSAKQIMDELKGYST